LTGAGSAPLQLENAKKLESGQVKAGQVRAGQVRAGQVRARQVRANQIMASQAMVPPTLVAILCVMSPLRRLPMPDVALRSTYFDTSNACFAE